MSNRFEEKYPYPEETDKIVEHLPNLNYSPERNLMEMLRSIYLTLRRIEARQVAKIKYMGKTTDCLKILEACPLPWVE